MGRDTKLYLSKEWELNEIKQVMEKRLNLKVEVHDCSRTSIGMFMFLFKTQAGNERTMYIHCDAKTPVGRMILLDLGYNDEAVRIMKQIAKVFGGLFEEDDCEGKLEFIDGELSGHNGLSYFLKYATFNGELIDENDLRSLNESIYKWHDEMYDSHIREMNLFSREKQIKKAN